MVIRIPGTHTELISIPWPFTGLVPGRWPRRRCVGSGGRGAVADAGLERQVSGTQQDIHV